MTRPAPAALERLRAHADRLRDCGFREAVAFLADGPPTAPAATAAAPPGLRLPAPAAALWPPVRDFLARARGLDPGPPRALPPQRHALRRPPPQRRLHLPRPLRHHHRR